MSQAVQANRLERPSVWRPQVGHCSVVKYASLNTVPPMSTAIAPGDQCGFAESGGHRVLLAQPAHQQGGLCVGTGGSCSCMGELTSMPMAARSTLIQRGNVAPDAEAPDAWLVCRTQDAGRR
ncbi:hypothetical protein GCM10010449_57540 [Streptomyces rectiviolaceus]|uniref:Uncharacterized protein n=1 Tax=Streptomyces rectiviolaceus TaxID=332591 RepID=A0ABP6MX34_9ACTN